MYRKSIDTKFWTDHWWCGVCVGDTTGWQLCYLGEVLGRQEEEREHLLQFLQDDSMDDLREAAAMMAESETKARLAELHTKRRRLDLSNQGRLEMETFFFSV